MGPKVDEVDRKLFELSTNLEVKLEALTLLATSTGSERQVNSLPRLKDTVRSAATVLSAASTVADDNDDRTATFSASFLWPIGPGDLLRQWVTSTVDPPDLLQLGDTHSLGLPALPQSLDSAESLPSETLSRTQFRSNE